MDETMLSKLNISHKTSKALRRYILRLSFLQAFLLISYPTLAQVDQAKQAIAEGNFLHAVDILTTAIMDAPTPDAYLHLGIAYANLKQYDQTLSIYREAAQKYPNDPRFHSETAGIHLNNRDIELARQALTQALALAPTDDYANDLLASINLSQGDVEGALDAWNHSERPRIATVSQNFLPQFRNWVVRQSLPFSRGDILSYDLWRTTQERLYATKLFSNVGLEIEPSINPDLYNAIIRTSPRKNGVGEIVFDLLKGLPVKTVFFQLADLHESGFTWASSYRWDEDRKKASVALTVPLPLPAVPMLEFSNTWRSERWNLSQSIRKKFLPKSRFDYKVNTIRVGMNLVPHYRFKVAAGLEYRNRTATGKIEPLAMDKRDSGTLQLGVQFRPLEGRYSNQIHLEAFLARKNFLGDFDFSGLTTQIANRYWIDEQSEIILDWSISLGTSSGELPIDNYFLLGIGRQGAHLLRGHVVSERGQFGRGPMGTGFVLLNTDIERKLLTVPMFNALSIPYVKIKAMGFFDSAKVSDRNQIFRQGEWMKDFGVGMQFEIPTGSFTVLYGRDTLSKMNNFYGYVERRFW